MPSQKRIFVLLLCLIVITFCSYSQSFLISNNNERLLSHLKINKKYQQLYGLPINVSYKDYSQLIDSLYLEKYNQKFLARQINIYSKDISNITFSPVLSTEAFGGKDFFQKSALGGSVHCQIKENLSISGLYARYWQNMPVYQRNIFDTLPIINNTGKKINNNYQINYYTWSISYSPFSYLNLQAGRDKQFVGVGYHSMLYSDWAPPCEYFQINVNVSKIHYRYNISYQKDYDRFDYSNLYGKFTVYHFLNIKATKKLSFQIFESIVWQQSDTLGHNGIEVNYLNPIIFYRFIEYGLGSAENALVGLGFQWEIFKRTKLYGQFLLDELTYKEFIKFNGYWGNKNGLQIGLKHFKTMPFGDISIITEYNQVTPFTFSHFKGLQVYSHMHHPLAHPLGSGFRECLLKLDFYKNSWNYSLKTNFSQFGTDFPGEDQGNNIHKSDRDKSADYGNKLINGIPNNLYYTEIKTGYMINPYWNLKIEGGIIYRIHTSENLSDNNFYAFIGLKTNIFREDLTY